MKKLCTLFAVCLFFTLSKAQQFTSAEVGINGLTCSMCTRTTELSIRKLDFVDSVIMDLTNTNGIIIFKKGAVVSVEKIAKAVKDAGFSVRYLKAGFDLDKQNISSGSCFMYKGGQYKFLSQDSTSLSGTATLIFVGKNYMPPKEFKKWSGKVKDACTAGKQTYYVTI